MLFRRRLSFSRKLKIQPQGGSKRRRNRRESSLVQQPICVGPSVEALEARQLLSATVVAASTQLATPTFVIKGQATAAIKPAVTAGVAPIDPAQMVAAYGVNQISFNGVVGNGAGQTIAIVDAFNDPDIISDAASFSTQWGLQQFNVSGGPTLSVLNQSGGTSLPPDATARGWDLEESLDVEWAHSIAPQANIILYEATSNTNANLDAAVTTAAHNAAVSVISMSWGGGESSSEVSNDSTFVTPSGHQGITFLASTGDDAAPAGYPAFSPNVVAVGGTTLDIDSSGDYLGEGAWADGGGGKSVFESIPSYQSGLNGINGASTTTRNVPDVSMDADPNSGVYVLDTFGGGWFQVGGTSLSAPMWGGLIAIANQGRALQGQSTLNGQTQTLPMLYNLPSSDFHDVTTGNDGFAAGPGYDLATGLGTPIANLLVPGLAGIGTTAPPSISAPATGSLSENGSLTFSTGNSDAISITDAAAGSNADSLTLSVSHGTLTLVPNTGLSFTAGSNGSSSFTVSGTVANLDAALNGLVYQPTTLYTGADSLGVSVSDPTDSLSASTSVSLTVAALSAPGISAPGTGSLSENGSLTFSSGNSNPISVTDAAAGSNADSLSLSVAHGTLALGSTTGLSFTTGTNGSSSFTVSGTVTNLNAALNGLIYQPTSLYSGPDSLSVSVTDPGDTLSTSTSVALTVTAFSAPSISAPGSASLSENASLAFSSGNGNAISFTDPAAGSNADSLSLSVSHGTLALGSTTGLSFTTGTNGSASFTVTGAVASLNSALNGVTYSPTTGYTGPDSLGISVSNPGSSLSSSTSVSLTVNALAAPGISAPGTASVTENSSLVFSSGNSNAISVTDAAAGVNADSLSLSVSHGRLSLGSTTGLSFTTGTNGSASFTVSGSVANLNAALSGLTYAPTTGYTGADSLAASISDPTDSLSNSTSVALTVNTASPPVITAPATGSMSENGSLVFSTGNSNAISFTDVAAGVSADSLTLSVSHGMLTLASTTGLSFTTGTNGSASFTVSGSVANLDTALNGLTYKPTATYVGSDSLALSVSDPGDSLSAATTVALTVTALSAPVIVAPPTGTLNQNGSLVFSTGNGNAVSFTDAAAGTGADSLTLSVTHGTLTLASTTGLSFTTGANGSASFTVTGTVANLNAALNGLTYRPTSGYSGADSISVSVADAGDNQSAAKSVSLTVNALAGPVLSAPATGSLTENATLTFSTANSNLISFTDSAAGTAKDTLTLSVSHGTLKLSRTTGLTFTTGKNNAASFTVTGTVANLNAALSGMVYTPTKNFAGADSLATKVADPNGQSATKTVALSVNAIAPTLTAPTTGTVAKNGTLTFSRSAIKIADVNAGTAVEQVVLTSTNGTLKLGSTTGITFVSGANSSASMTISGTLTNLNAALNGLKFTPTTNFNGSGTVSVKYTDAGDGLSVSANIAIKIGTGGAATGSPIPGPSQQSKGVSPPSQSTPSTVDDSASSPSTSGSLPADDLVRWDGFMAAMVLLNR
jgi:hypothetical protein